MKFLLTISCFLAVTALSVLAIPAPQDALRPESSHSDDALPGMFLNLMKDVMVPPKEGSGSDPILKDIISLMGTLTHPPADAHHEMAQNDGKTEQDPLMAMLSSFMKGSSSEGKGGGVLNDPAVKMLEMMAQTALQATNASDTETDPVIRMGTTAMKTFLDALNEGPVGSGEHGDLEEDRPPHHVSDGRDDRDPIVPIMKLMAKCVQALSTDKSADPVGAVMNVVLDDPILADNPVIKAIKAATNDKTGDPLNAMIDSLMENPEIQRDPYVPPILRIAKNVLHNMPKEGDGDPLASLLNALAPPPQNPHKALVSPDV